MKCGVLPDLNETLYWTKVLLSVVLLSLFRAPCLRGQLVFRSQIAQVGGRNLSKAYLRFLGMKAVSCDGTGL